MFDVKRFGFSADWAFLDYLLDNVVGSPDDLGFTNSLTFIPGFNDELTIYDVFGVSELDEFLHLTYNGYYNSSDRYLIFGSSDFIRSSSDAGYVLGTCLNDKSLEILDQIFTKSK